MIIAIDLVETEEWKDIEGYGGHYQVSNMGAVRSVDRYVNHYRTDRKRCAGATLSHDINYMGYHRVTLYKGNTRTRMAVHRLVADAFIPNPNGLPELNHKDENMHNNSVSNLEWCTKSYNINYGTRSERASSHLRKPVAQFDMDWNLISTFVSASEAKRQTGCSCISDVCLGKRPFCKGFHWSYI